ncbi:MAG: RAD55 family ATPase [Thermoplasmatota archaeon]
MEIRKISTGVEGLDKMLGGGLLEGRPYSVIGGPGSGKSILGWQFLMAGRIKDETSLYITIDEPHYEIRDNMRMLGLEDSGIKIMDLSPGDIRDDGDLSSLTYLDRELPMQLEKLRPLRVVLDSTTSIRAMEGDPVKARRRILALMRTLSQSDDDSTDDPITSLLLTEDESDIHPLEAYLSRGVIRLHNKFSKGTRLRAIAIEKMRGSDFDDHLRPMKIGRGGILVAETDSMILEL